MISLINSSIDHIILKNKEEKKKKQTLIIEHLQFGETAPFSKIIRYLTRQIVSTNYTALTQKPSLMITHRRIKYITMIDENKYQGRNLQLFHIDKLGICLRNTSVKLVG